MHELPWWKSKFAYCKVPKDLFYDETYRHVSPLAKLLYAFLLDRTSLSYSGGKKWMTENGEYFVFFPIAEIMERFCCGRDRASALLKELEEAQLITRTLKGRGRPYRIIVQPFITQEYSQVPICRESPHDDADESVGNKTKSINTDIVSTDLLMKYDRAEWLEIIRTHIYYDVLVGEIPREQLDGIVNIIVDTMSHVGQSFRIFGAQIPKAEVMQRFMYLNDMHIRYVYCRLENETNNIQNLRGYILARLYEAADVMDSYFAIQVNHDFFSERKEKYR